MSLFRHLAQRTLIWRFEGYRLNYGSQGPTLKTMYLQMQLCWYLENRDQEAILYTSKGGHTDMGSLISSFHNLLDGRDLSTVVESSN